VEPVDFFASERQYADHLVPIWQALHPAERGRFFGSSLTMDRLADAGIEAVNALPRAGTRPVVVAAHSDYMRTGARAVVYVEHGAGQRYDGAGQVGHAGYSGGKDRDRTVLFLCNSEAVADANRAVYRAPAEVVGCPKLDRWHRQSWVGHGGLAGVVAFSFHWDCKVAPEARTALPHYLPHLGRIVADLQAAGWEVLGHGHPKAWARLLDLWRGLGVEPVAEFDDVLARADVYVCDNSSTLYEFASTDRPVVLLNAPWYRRDVEHGLRFWSEAGVGQQVDEPDLVVPTVLDSRAYDTDAGWAAMRRASVQRVYPLADGQAATRAADAMRRHLAGQQWREPMTAGPDPFVGTRVVRTRSTQRPFPSDRLLRLGATDDEVSEARAAWDALTYDQQENAAAMLEQQTDDELRVAIAADREDVELDQLWAWAEAVVKAGDYPDTDTALDALDQLVVGEQGPELTTLLGVVHPLAPLQPGVDVHATDTPDGAEAAGGSGTTGTEGEASAAGNPADAEPATAGAGYPTDGGTVAGVLGWVGADGADNVARARHALAQELARDEKDQRKGVLDAVRKITGAGG
jgi:hypothetical protein